MKTPNMGNPTDQQHFKLILAMADRQRRYQRLLWRKLRAIMAEGRRDQLSGDWGRRYVDLLERAARHQRRMERTREEWFEWFDSRRMKPRPPTLRIVPKV